MIQNQQINKKIEDFVTNQVVRRGLDERTAKAYRIDLEHLYQWLWERQIDNFGEKEIDGYLNYLMKEKQLKSSTITRKYRVFQYYFRYLVCQGDLSQYCPITQPILIEKEKKADNALSKKEVDSFFIALNQEYENLDCDFRRNICLRDSIMMELLFYHGIEISELLKIKITDYDRKTHFLSIHGKQGKQRTVYLFSGELRNKVEWWIEEHSYFEKEYDYRDYLFLSKMGRPLSMKMVILIFDKYRVMAGIKKGVTPKNLKVSMKRYAQELMIEKYG